MTHTFTDEDCMRLMKGLMLRKNSCPRCCCIADLLVFHVSCLCGGLAARAHPKRRHVWLVKCTRLRLPTLLMCIACIAHVFCGYPLTSLVPVMFFFVMQCRLRNMKYRKRYQRKLGRTHVYSSHIESMRMRLEGFVVHVGYVVGLVLLKVGLGMFFLVVIRHVSYVQGLVLSLRSKKSR